jgi:hypothetical protein
MHFQNEQPAFRAAGPCLAAQIGSADGQEPIARPSTILRCAMKNRFGEVHQLFAPSPNGWYRREHAIVGGGNRVATPASLGSADICVDENDLPAAIVVRASSPRPASANRCARLRSPRAPRENSWSVSGTRKSVPILAPVEMAARGRALRRGRNCSTPRKRPESRVRQFDGGARVCDRDSCELVTPDPRPVAAGSVVGCRCTSPLIPPRRA